MKAAVETSNKQNQSKAAANRVSQQKKHGQGDSEFVDNRSETKALKSLQMMINNSSRMVAQRQRMANITSGTDYVITGPNKNVKMNNPKGPLGFGDNGPGLAASQLKSVPNDSAGSSKFTQSHAPSPVFHSTLQLRNIAVTPGNENVIQRLEIDKVGTWLDDDEIKSIFAQRVADRTATTGKHNYAKDLMTGTITRSSTSSHAEIALIAMSKVQGDEDMICILSEYKPCPSCEKLMELIEEERGVKIGVVYLLEYDQKGDGDPDITREYYKKWGYLSGGGDFNYRVENL